jgi:hypothetical protein
MRNRVLTVAVLSVLLVSLAVPAFAVDVSTFSFTFTFHNVQYRYTLTYIDNNHNGRPNIGDTFVSVSIVRVD